MLDHGNPLQFNEDRSRATITAKAKGIAGPDLPRESDHEL